MTSSLVGSEMCIRDSTHRVPVASPTDEPEDSPGESPQFWAVPTHESGAVSYTHLTLPTICSV
eukprot:6391642-Prorocentrum_lima.AAC.1